MVPKPRVWMAVCAMALLCGHPLPGSSKEKSKDDSQAIADALKQLVEPAYAARRAAQRRLFTDGMAAVPALVEALKQAEAAQTVRMPALAALKEAYGGTARSAEVRHLLTRITGHSCRTAAGWSDWWEKHKEDSRESLVGADLRHVADLAKSKNPADRCEALQIVARVGDEACLKPLEPLFTDKDPKVRREACRALAETAQPKTASALKDLVTTREAWLRQEALSAAGMVGLPDAKGALKAAAEDRKHPLERAHAVLGLARLGDASALTEAAEGLGQRADQDFHPLYCEALACFPKEKAVEALQKALAKKPDYPLMPAAALAALGDKTADVLKPVETVLKAPLPPPNGKDPNLRIRARQDALFAARAVADVLNDQPGLRGPANDVLKALIKDVNNAIDKGVKALKNLEEKKQKNLVGSWPFKADGWASPGFQQGASALALLALHKSGVPKDDPDFARGVDWLVDTLDHPRGKAIENIVYAKAMAAIFLSELDPDAHRDRIKAIIEWLMESRITSKTDRAREGQWNYYGTQSADQCSNSVTHYGLLGIGFASRNVKGLFIPNDFWQTSMDYFKRVQRTNGGWGYDKPGTGDKDSYGTMTGVGVISLLLCQAELLDKEFQEFDAREQEPLRDGMDWLADRFDDEKVSGMADSGSGSNDFRFYWYYTIERMASVMGTDYIGNRHWYHDFASRILELQSPNGEWVGTQNDAEVPTVATSFALLVLKRASFPIQIQPPPRPYAVDEPSYSTDTPQPQPAP